MWKRINSRENITDPIRARRRRGWNITKKKNAKILVEGTNKKRRKCSTIKNFINPRTKKIPRRNRKKKRRKIEKKTTNGRQNTRTKDSSIDEATEKMNHETEPEYELIK